jgi:hypothetical protein
MVVVAVILADIEASGAVAVTLEEVSALPR